MTITDLEEAADLKPQDVREYLERKGWTQGRDLGGNRGWVSPDSEWSVAYYWLTESELPTAISQIAAAEERTAADVKREIAALRAEKPRDAEGKEL